MKSNFLLYFSIPFIFLSACSSDDEEVASEILEVSVLVASETVNEQFKTEYAYDSRNRLIGWMGTRNNFSYTLDFDYDNENRVVSYNYMENGSSSFDNRVEFTYNNQGQLVAYDDVELTHDGSTITATGTIEGYPDAIAIMETNAKGLITKLTEENRVTDFEYDPFGNMIRILSYDQTNALAASYELSYDSQTNPFYGQYQSIYIERFLQYFFPFEGIYFDGYEGFTFPYLKNNLVSITRFSNFLSEYDFDYNEAGLPVRVNAQYVTADLDYTIEYY